MLVNQIGRRHSLNESVIHGFTGDLIRRFGNDPATAQ